MDTKISANFWNDEALGTPELRLAALWLKTNAHVNLIGFGELSVRRFVFDTGLNAEALEQCCQALGKGLVREGKGYWLRDFIGEQFGRGASLARNNMRKPLVRAIESLGTPWVGDAVFEEYPELNEGSEAAVFVAEAKGSQSPRTEQSRAEQNRAEQSRVIGGAGGKVADGQKPGSVDEVLAHASTIGLPADEARKFFDHYEANGWRQGGRAALKSWRAALRLWKRRWDEGGPAGTAGKKSPGGGGGPPAGYDAKQPNAATGGVELEN